MEWRCAYRNREVQGSGFPVIQRLLPLRVRAAARSLSRLWNENRPLLWRILECVRRSSLVEVLACLEDGGGEGASTFTIRLISRKAPLTLRRGSSDFAVFRQVILEDQYNLPEISEPEYIVDAGANIGLSSVVFLERYPRCQVVAIEPDPQNYEIATKNLECYGERCRVLPIALWSSSGTVAVQRGNFRDGLDWSCQTVAVCEPEQTTVNASTMTALLLKAGFPRIDFLKVDIEGAELQVFGEGDTSFLERTQCCATECHDSLRVDVYCQTMSRYGFSIRHEGELVIAWRETARR